MQTDSFRYHLLLGKQDWAPALAESLLAWDPERQAVTLQPHLFRWRIQSSDRPTVPADRRGAAQDRWEHWYWISQDRAGIMQHRADGSPAALWWSLTDWTELAGGALVDLAHPPGSPTKSSTGEFQPVLATAPPALELRTLSSTPDGYLIAAAAQPPGLFLFDLWGGGPPAFYPWPLTGPFQPIAAALSPAGCLFLLDEAGRSLWAFDRLLQPFSEDGVLPKRFALPATGRPADLAALPDGSVLILVQMSEGPDRLLRWQEGALVGDSVDLVIPDAYTIGPEGNRPLSLHAIATQGALLYGVDKEGNQSYAFQVTDGEEWQIELLLQYLPMRRFTGKGLVTTPSGVYYDSDTTWYPLVEQPRPRYEQEGSIVLPVLDGKDPGVTWHRLVLDGALPAGTGVRFESRTADDLFDLAFRPWQSEPQPYRREAGAELPYHQPFAAHEIGKEGVGSWELLLQAAKGRYLELRLTLTGTGRSTPWVRALRIHYARFSYLSYLPAVYREDPVSADFVERFLANPEGLLTSWEERIARAERLFDPRTVPPEFMDWLGGWLGILFDPSWGEERRRLFLEYAPLLFGERGTVKGLIRLIRLATDAEPTADLFRPDGCALDEPGGIRIVEAFLTRLPSVAVAEEADAQVGSATGDCGCATCTETRFWAPAEGVEQLHERYRTFLQERYDGLAALARAWSRDGLRSWQQVRFPPVQPTRVAEAADWNAFREETFIFAYTPVTIADTAAWAEFLTARYRRFAPLSAVWGNQLGTSMGALKLPTEMPTSDPALTDWLQFVSLFLPARQKAHRFTVLVPASFDSPAPDLALVERVVEAAKPAQTAFEVQQYWAFCRIGEARVGLDTIIAPGARLTALQLQTGALAASYIGGRGSADAPRATVIGRRGLNPSS
ncbi:MAG TPA: phage tail protein [Symbiobacteriaceae bacterium]|nr:phage tail protein [Symbiobacteriaceae bacterium]